MFVRLQEFEKEPSQTLLMMQKKLNVVYHSVVNKMLQSDSERSYMGKEHIILPT